MENIKDYDQTEDQDIESPAWHGEILRKRAEKIESGETEFMSLEELKQKIRG